ncbi:uncharacterized protein EAE97_006249 [Botrytis byssoidea]|uniref:Alpha/beta hydrolase fold-3 domain-containing protein n=1 Tax=Botrytis byssoidea TaxID=139641 RepID=A0A9P5IIU2_9HELO|nr:uncharacterized protein EAE97_006249 [Botrytis byssoidea]KAF7942795.1 hypothetical protein EAE97_006249 [Botrytis byssoidea]
MGNPSTAGYKPEWLEVITPPFLSRQAPSRSTTSIVEKALSTRPVPVGDAPSIKKQFNDLVAELNSQRPPPDTSVQTRDTSADGVPVRIYTPPNATQDDELHLGVYYHGGGYCGGSLDSEDMWCRYIAKNVPCVLVSVDYRLGPEHKFPAMLDDSVKAFEWAYKHASELNSSQSKLFTIGASAGGGLALTVAHDLIAAGKRSQIKGVVAMVPIAAHHLLFPRLTKIIINPTRRMRLAYRLTMRII